MHLIKSLVEKSRDGPPDTSQAPGTSSTAIRSQIQVLLAARSQLLKRSAIELQVVIIYDELCKPGREAPSMRRRR